MKLVAVGNMTIDEIYSGSRHVATVPGGASFYVANTANLLGATTRIVSSIGPDYPARVLKWVERQGISLDRVSRSSSPNTRFLLRYSKNERALRLIAKGEPISASATYRRSDVVHLGPVFQEIDYRALKLAQRRSRLLSIDLQGLLRKVERSGRVLVRTANVDTFLRSCDLAKAAEAEAYVVTKSKDPVEMAHRLALKGPRFAIVTLGARGLILANRSRSWRVPAYPEKNRVDTTGAGDAMVAGWLVAFWRTRDPLWASAVGAGTSSMIVRHIGLRKFRFNHEELLRRASWVYARIEKGT